MLYLILGEAVPASLERRRTAEAAHSERLALLQDEGRLVVAGSCPAIDSPDPGPSGISASVAIAEFDSLESARAWAEADPYVAAGVYGKLVVRPFLRARPA